MQTDRRSDTRRSSDGSKVKTCVRFLTRPGEDELIQPHVDRLHELAAIIGRVTPGEFSTTFQEECSFIVGRLLVPHMEAIGTSLYGRLEEVMDKRHSEAPMRAEHERLRALFASLCEYSELVADERLTKGNQVGLRRVLYRLYAMLKVHLAEEELYLGGEKVFLLDREVPVENRASTTREPKRYASPRSSTPAASCGAGSSRCVRRGSPRRGPRFAWRRGAGRRSPGSSHSRATS